MISESGHTVILTHPSQSSLPSRTSLLPDVPPISTRELPSGLRWQHERLPSSPAPLPVSRINVDGETTYLECLKPIVPVVDSFGYRQSLSSSEFEAHSPSLSPNPAPMGILIRESGSHRDPGKRVYKSLPQIGPPNTVQASHSLVLMHSDKQPGT